MRVPTLGDDDAHRLLRLLLLRYMLLLLEHG
jgi:hypothetical protein